MGHLLGEPYRLELRSADATTAAVTKLFDSEGNERVLADNEYVRLENVNIHMANAVEQVDVFDDVNDNNAVNEGERIVTVGTNTTGNGPANHDIQFDGDGKRLSIGRKPKVLAAVAGEVVVTGVVHVHVGKTQSRRSDWKANDFGQ